MRNIHSLEMAGGCSRSTRGEIKRELTLSYYLMQNEKMAKKTIQNEKSSRNNVKNNVEEMATINSD